MALDARDFSVTGQWAKKADTVIPPVPITGRAYRKTDMTQTDAESGQAYDVIWESARNNQKDYEATGMALEAEVYGWPRWSPLTSYVAHASKCTGPDGEMYIATQDSGAGTPDGPQNPETTSGYWTTIKNYIGGGIEPWDAGKNYALPALVWGSDDHVYQAVAPSLNQDPVLDDGTHWLKLGTIKDIKEISKDQCLIRASGTVSIPDGQAAMRVPLDVVDIDEFAPTGWDNTLYQFTAPRDGMYAFKAICRATPVSSTSAGCNIYIYKKTGANDPVLIGHTQIIMQRGYLVPLVGLTIQNLSPGDVVYFELISGYAATLQGMNAIICQI